MLVFLQTIVNLIKKPVIVCLLCVQLFLVLGQFCQSLGAYNDVHNKGQIISTLAKTEDTIITVEALAGKEEMIQGEKRDERDIETVLNKYTSEYNKFFNGGAFLNEEDAAKIIPRDSNYQYLLDDSYTEISIVREPIKGDLVLVDGENFTNEDFDRNLQAYPVLLGEAYRGVHKVGDIFTIDMTTGGGLGKIPVIVKGFIKAKTIQPMMTGYILASTKEINNHFILAVSPEVEHSMFQATSFILNVNEQELQALQHEVYQLENNKYYIEDLLSSIKSEALHLKEEQKMLLIQIISNCIVTALSFYLIAKQQFISNKYEYAISQLLGNSPWFNVKVVFLQYFIIVLATAVFWIVVEIIKGNLVGSLWYNIITISTIFLIIFLAILPTLSVIYYQAIANDLKEEG